MNKRTILKELPVMTDSDGREFYWKDDVEYVLTAQEKIHYSKLANAILNAPLDFTAQEGEGDVSKLMTNFMKEYTHTPSQAIFGINFTRWVHQQPLPTPPKEDE